MTADGVDKRSFYVEQQERIADFANKVHSGEITNAAGEKLPEGELEWRKVVAWFWSGRFLLSFEKNGKRGVCDDKAFLR